MHHLLNKTEMNRKGPLLQIPFKVYTGEIFYKERVLRKTSTLWLCSGFRFA